MAETIVVPDAEQGYATRPTPTPENTPKPRYVLIAGRFYIRYLEPDLARNGPQPDGDTITFLADNDELVQGLPRFSGRRPDTRHLGAHSVRFEGIDTLETHFFTRHQNLEFARRARDRMLEFMGFDNVVFFDDLPNNVESADNNPARGYLLANGIESHGRVLALVYPGDPPQGSTDGGRVFVDEATLGASANATLVNEGLAYAELYKTMPFPLIVEMRRLVKAARTTSIGLWPKESPSLTSGRAPKKADDLSNLVMFPKLFRRLASFFDDGHDGQGLGGFDAWVRADPVNRDDQVLLSNGEFGHLHDVYTVSQGAIRLTELPEDLTFQPDPPA